MPQDFGHIVSALSQIGHAGVVALGVAALDVVRTWVQGNGFQISVGGVLQNVLGAMVAQVAELLTPPLLAFVRGSLTAIPEDCWTK